MLTAVERFPPPPGSIESRRRDMPPRSKATPRPAIKAVEGGLDERLPDSSRESRSARRAKQSGKKQT